VVSSVIDLLLRTLFNIEAATVVTLSVESYPFVFTVYKEALGRIAAGRLNHYIQVLREQRSKIECCKLRPS